MARYKECDNRQRVILAVSLEDQVMPGTIEHAIHVLVEEKIDTSIFDIKYKNDQTGRIAYNPKLLLKVVLLAYSRGIVSSRKIERACIENVVFRALSFGQTPDHSTIASFVSSMGEQIVKIYVNILLVCEEMNLLGGTHFALDGVKLPSNASRELSGTIETLLKKKEKLENKVKEKIEKHQEMDREDDQEKDERERLEKQIDKLKKKADKIGEWLKDNEPKQGKQGEIKSNITDNESANMMTSHGAIQGYNAQAIVDEKHQIIVHAEVFGVGQDHELLPPMVSGAKDNLQSIGYSDDHMEGKILSADSNYHSETNLNKVEEEKLDAYIPDVNFRKRDPRFADQYKHKPKKDDKFSQEDFQYDSEKDQYICPNGRVLKLDARNIKNKKRIYNRYEAVDCSECPLKDRCIKSERKKNRRYLLITVDIIENSLSKKMIEKIDSKEGKCTYQKRIAIVEPAFANIRIQKHLDRFTLRGKIKVNIQWMLYSLVHNIEKIANYGSIMKLRACI